MKATFRKYQADPDFLRVRDFLKETYFAFGTPINWGFERWNWARYHPCMFWEHDPVRTAANIQFWDRAVGLWENEEHELVGVVHPEMPRPGQGFIEHRPGYDAILDDMLAYAEAMLRDPVNRHIEFDVYEDDCALRAAMEKRGYRQDTEHPGYWAEYQIRNLPSVNLPDGYAVRSMADAGSRLDRRCKVQGVGFNHPDPAEWTTPWEYQHVQQAPDYRADQDLYVVGPDGEYVSCCIVWYDDVNHFGVFEPVCTHPDFRRKGFGRTVMYEGLRRLAARGATVAYVGSGQEFYKAIGFAMKYRSYVWTKTC